METKKSLRSRVFSLAWKLYKNHSVSQYTGIRLSFSQCLKNAWNILRTYDYRPALKNILNMLSFVDTKKVILKDGQQHEVYGTTDFFRITNKKEIRKSTDPDVRELVEAGKVPLIDIINERKKQKSFQFTKHVEKRRRPRIIKMAE